MALTKKQEEMLKQLLSDMSEEDLERLSPSKKTNKKQATANFPLGKRPNKFVKSVDFDKFKADSKIDRALWGKNKPEERSEMEQVSAVCVKCGTIEEVNPIFAYKDEVDRKMYFTCEHCMPKR